MSETNQTEMVETQPSAEMEQGNDSNLSVEQLRAELQNMQSALKKANNESARRRKQIEAFEAAEQKRKDDELSEMERLQNQLAEAQAANTRYETERLKREVAAEVGLPESLALRLQGDDRDALKDDAEALLKSLPKPQAPQLPATNPGANGKPAKETPQQRLARVRGAGVNAFDPSVALRHGGGVVQNQE